MLIRQAANKLSDIFEVKDSSKNFKKLMNLNFTDVSNQTYYIGEYDIPYILSNPRELPDYIALYGEPGQYHRTNNTCVAFYEYELAYDGLLGIYNAIYYDIPELKAFYLNRFANVPCFIGPDYSSCGDIPFAETMYRLFRARVISIWLSMELGAFVVPNITYSSTKCFPYMLLGAEECTVVAFSTKGIMRKKQLCELTKAAIRYTVDRLPLKAIIVYAVNGDNQPVYDLFDYAISQNVQVVIPDNTLRIRNSILRGAA